MRSSTPPPSVELSIPWRRGRGWGLASRCLRVNLWRRKGWHVSASPLGPPDEALEGLEKGGCVGYGIWQHDNLFRL